MRQWAKAVGLIVVLAAVLFLVPASAQAQYGWYDYGIYDGYYDGYYDTGWYDGFYDGGLYGGGYYTPGWYGTYLDGYDYGVYDWYDYGW